MRYFIGQDLYGNWYCLPVEKREGFDRLCNREDAYNFDAWTEIVKYKIDIEKLTFKEPIF